MNTRLHWSSNTMSDTNLSGLENTSCKLQHTVLHICQSCWLTTADSRHHPPNDVEVWALWGVQMEKRGQVIWRISCGHVPRHHVEPVGTERHVRTAWTDRTSSERRTESCLMNCWSGCYGENMTLIFINLPGRFQQTTVGHKTRLEVRSVSI